MFRWLSDIKTSELDENDSNKNGYKKTKGYLVLLWKDGESAGEEVWWNEENVKIDWHSDQKGGTREEEETQEEGSKGWRRRRGGRKFAYENSIVASIEIIHVLHIQHESGTAVPRFGRYEFHQFLNSKQTGHLAIMMDCLYAKCIPYISDCVMAEIEKLGPKFKVALRIAKDSRFERLPCLHKGTYADDCITQRVTQHKCYIVATCDKDLRRRIRKIPGVPIMYLKDRRYTIERMPDAYGAPKE